jgi:chromosome segregation ATPase
MSDNQNTLILAALERLESGQTQLQTKLGRLESSQTQLYAELVARIDQLQSAVTATDARMDAQDEALSRFRADLVDERGRTRNALMARMDRLQESLVSQHEADVVNFDANSSMHSSGKSADSRRRSGHCGAGSN